MICYSMTNDIRVSLADLKNAQHVRATLNMLSMYAADAMGAGRPLDPAVRRRLPAGLRKYKALVFLAWSGRQPAGVAVCFIRYSTFSAAPILNIHDFAVSPEHRRQGVGAALLDAVEKLARRRGCRRLTLEVRADNPAARALYRNFGIAPGNPPYDYWTKELAPTRTSH